MRESMFMAPPAFALLLCSCRFLSSGLSRHLLLLWRSCETADTPFLAVHSEVSLIRARRRRQSATADERPFVNAHQPLVLPVVYRQAFGGAQSEHRPAMRDSLTFESAIAPAGG